MGPPAVDVALEGGAHDRPTHADSAIARPRGRFQPDRGPAVGRGRSATSSPVPQPTSRTDRRPVDDGWSRRPARRRGACRLPGSARPSASGPASSSRRDSGNRCPVGAGRGRRSRRTCRARRRQRVKRGAPDRSTTIAYSRIGTVTVGARPDSSIDGTPHAPVPRARPAWRRRPPTSSAASSRGARGAGRRRRSWPRTARRRPRRDAACGARSRPRWRSITSRHRSASVPEPRLITPSAARRSGHPQQALGDVAAEDVVEPVLRVVDLDLARRRSAARTQRETTSREPRP